MPFSFPPDPEERGGREVALLVCQAVGLWPFTLPHNTRAPVARSLVAAEPGLLSVGETVQGPLVWGWGSGSSWVGGHVVQPTLHVHSWLPVKCRVSGGTFGEP